MKSICALSLVLIWGLGSFAQISPEAFIKKIPSLPNDSCRASEQVRTDFSNKVSGLLDQLKSEIRIMKKQGETDPEAAKSQAMEQMASQYGLSAEEMQKMKSGKKMTAEEKTALANKMMMQQTNISIGEAKNLSKMSESGKKAWTEAYAAEGMANAQANPKPQSNQNNALKVAQLIQEQTSLYQTVKARQQQILLNYAKIETDPTRLSMLKRMEEWQNQRMAMSGVDYGQGKKMDSLLVLNNTERVKYCEMFTPRLWKVLREQLADLKASYPDYQRLGEITNQVSKLQPVSVGPTNGPEIEYFLYIQLYLEKLENAFQYALPPQE